MAHRCLIVDDLHENIFPLLDGIGVEYEYQPAIKREGIKKLLPNFNGLIIRSKTIVDEDLLNGSNLSYVARPGAGIDNLDQEYLAKKGIAIINAPEGNRDAVGEHTIGMMLSILHNLNQGHEQVMKGVWDRPGNRGAELGSLTVGIIGYGNTGSSLAKKLQGFGCKIIAYDKYLEAFPDSNAQQVELTTLQEEADIVSLHIPLTTKSLAMASISFFRSFTKPIIFINTSRGEITPFKGIKQAFEEKILVSAGLDVLECEKLDMMTPDQKNDFNWLKSSGKVHFTPHVAGWTVESYTRLNEVLVEKIGAFLDHS